MAYAVHFKKSAKKELLSLEPQTRERILAAVEALSSNPTPANSLKMRGVPLRRIRVGVFRVLYEIQNDVLVVYVVKIAHRREAYQNL